MGLTASVLVIFIALLVAVSTTYNAYLLRGGKLAWSQILMLVGMISLVFSFVVAYVWPNLQIIPDLKFADLFFILGLAFLLAASLKLRLAFK